MKQAKTIAQYADPKWMTPKINAFIKYNKFELLDIKYHTVEESGLWGSKSSKTVITGIYEDFGKQPVFDIDDFRIDDGLCLKCKTIMKTLDEFETHDCKFVGLQKECNCCHNKFSVKNVNEEALCSSCWANLVAE